MAGWTPSAAPSNTTYAFQLTAPSPATWMPTLPPKGSRLGVEELAARVMTPESAGAFSRRVTRWGGPEDVAQDGTRPYAAPQTWFEEAPWRARLTRADVDGVVRGVVRVMRSPRGVVDYLVRDHHMLDVVLHHHACTGSLPGALMHLDRHSDWCDDAYLHARVPQQAATWWALLPGLKRPDGLPVLREQDVCFATAQAVVPGMPGRNVGASRRVPGCVDTLRMDWRCMLEDAQDKAVDWVSVDLDVLQPHSQYRAVDGLLRDARFARALAHAAVRVFCLSPQFTRGGDRFEHWVVSGSVATSLRLLNVLRSG